MQPKPGFYLAVFATITALIVIGVGAYTRLTHAGLSCPDWPGCYGFLSVPISADAISTAEKKFPNLPVNTEKGWTEMNHRYLAMFLVILVLGLLLLSIKHRKNYMYPKFLPGIISVLIIIQALFGMWTVTLKLWPQVVTIHLIGGFSVLGLLFLSSLKLSGFHEKNIIRQHSLLRYLSIISLVTVCIQIIIGGWVSANYAALACPDFPLCQGQWWPPMDFTQGFSLYNPPGPNYQGGILGSEARTAIHFSHRVGAIITSLLLTTLVVQLTINRLYKTATIIFLSFIVQVSLGIGNIISGLSLINAVAHNLGGALLLLTLIFLNYKIKRC